MMITEDQVRQLINEHIAGTSKFLVELVVSPNGSIAVMMDGDDGYSIADCVALSRHIEHQFDREEYDFSLEVSSYGVGNPLLLPRQYAKNGGRLLEVTLEDNTSLEGRIVQADETGVDLMVATGKPRKGVAKPVEMQPVRLSYSDIRKAVIKIEF